MTARSSDPYLTLGVRADASAAEVRAAYRRLVQLHHPDHNGGSPESARRFEAVQEAYAQIRSERGGSSFAHAEAGADQRSGFDEKVSSRLADIERELNAARESRERGLKAAREVRERARRAAREATSDAGARRASDEELGYVTTDDSFSKILADAASELSGRVSQVREHHEVKDLSDLLDELASKLGRKPPAD